MHFRVQCIICSSRRRKHRPVALTSNVCNYDAHLMHIVLMHTYLYVLNMHLGRCMSDVHRHDAEIAVCFMHIKRSSSHALCLITKRSASEGNQAMYIAICICVYASEALNKCIDCIAKNRDAVDALDAPMKYLICTVVLLGTVRIVCREMKTQVLHNNNTPLQGSGNKRATYIF